MRTQLCSSCNNNAIKLKDRLVEFSNNKWIFKSNKVSINKLLYIKKENNVNNVFELLNKKPYLYIDGSKKDDRKKLKRTVRQYHQSEEYKNQNYEKWEGTIPPYIINKMKKHITKELITISGDKLNPNIHYVCKLCNEEQVQKFEGIVVNKGHNCTSNKSSGEVIIEKYLKERFDIKTQYETLKCINPITGRQLPYDI